MDTLFALRAGLCGHNLSREIQHLVKEHGIGWPKFVGDFPSLALGKRRVLAHPFQHITTATLQKVTRQPLALFRRSGWKIERGKVAVDQARSD